MFTAPEDVVVQPGDPSFDIAAGQFTVGKPKGAPKSPEERTNQTLVVQGIHADMGSQTTWCCGDDIKNPYIQGSLVNCIYNGKSFFFAAHQMLLVGSYRYKPWKLNEWMPRMTPYFQGGTSFSGLKTKSRTDVLGVTITSVNVLRTAVYNKGSFRSNPGRGASPASWLKVALALLFGLSLMTGDRGDALIATAKANATTGYCNNVSGCPSMASLRVTVGLFKPRCHVKFRLCNRPSCFY